MDQRCELGALCAEPLAELFAFCGIAQGDQKAIGRADRILVRVSKNRQFGVRRRLAGRVVIEKPFEA
jgi:hypothetical protein